MAGMINTLCVYGTWLLRIGEVSSGTERVRQKLPSVAEVIEIGPAPEAASISMKLQMVRDETSSRIKSNELLGLGKIVDQLAATLPFFEPVPIYSYSSARTRNSVRPICWES